MALPTGPIRSLKPTMPNFTGGTSTLKFSAIIYLQIEDDPERIAIKLLSPAAIGRSDEGEESVDIDLIPYDAAKKGVSRRHAVLERARNMVSLIDQDSTNGTFLNGQRLKPFERRVVRDGDEIRMGILTLRVYFYS